MFQWLILKKVQMAGNLMLIKIIALRAVFGCPIFFFKWLNRKSYDLMYIRYQNRFKISLLVVRLTQKSFKVIL